MAEVHRSSWGGVATRGAVLGLLAVAAAVPGAGPSVASASASASAAANPVVYTFGVVGTFGKVGQLQHDVPTPIAGIRGLVVQVSATNSDTYALTSTGAVYAWGVGSSGQLGNGSRTAVARRAVRVAFPAGIRIAALPRPMPYDGGLAVDTTGHLWAWGNNVVHDLCLPATGPVVRPARLSAPDVTQATGAGTHSLFESRGVVYACGTNGQGQLGDGTTTARAVPTPVVGLPRGPVKALTSSFEGSGALMADGSYYDWGLNAAGQLGDGTTANSPVPVKVDLSGPVRSTSQGGSNAANGQTLAILADGSMWAWGDNTWGQLGVGTTTDATTPVRVRLPGANRAVSVSSGGFSSYAIDARGRLWAWGRNEHGQLGTGGTGPDRRTPVAVGITVRQVSATATNAAGLGRQTARRPAASTTGAVRTTPYAVPAVRDTLAADPASPAAHDNEVMALAPQGHRLFAATDQWEYPGPTAYGQVLVKESASGPWKVFEQTQTLRVQAIDSFTIPADQGLGPGHSLLVTQTVVDGRAEIQWLLDGATSFSPADAFVLPSTGADVRSFGAHQSGGVWAVYAGVAPTGILRGVWSKTRHTLVFSPVPELAAAPPGSPGLKTQKVTGFADCGGALYVSINTRLYRRNDGPLPAGAARWVLVYQEHPVGAFNSGLRGLSCVTDDGRPALLVSTEGTGDVFRLDRLPRGHLDVPASAGPGHGVAGLVPVREFSPEVALRKMLAATGTNVPTTGTHAIDYVIAAYNNFETMRLDGATRQLFGLEWGYHGGCPATRTCAPDGFDAAACFAVRTDSGPRPTYALRCLSGPGFTPAAQQVAPVRQGQAFVSIRTIQPSPFGDRRIYYGGYDCDFNPADGAAWIGSSTVSALHLGPGSR